MTDETLNPDDDALDLDERELCPDGTCNGLLGKDGRCKVCGLPRDPSPHAPVEEGPSRGSAAAAPDEIDFDQRELCPDGACTGVLGDDGRCRACGRARAS